jgi:riboflavin kinase/FMN adenylyltransferase
MLRLTREAAAPLGWPAPAVALGNFDGVHRGHQALVRAVVDEARGRAGTALALTFDPHPALVLAPERAPQPLMQLEQRVAALEACGVQAVAVLPFTPEVARQAPEEFVRCWLVERLGIACVAVGPDFRFGHARRGDVELLSRLARELGFETRVVAPVTEGGLPVSSTRVRQALAEGEVELAARLLGRPHEVQGRVCAGDARGRLLGYPTANLEPPRVCLPARGVYAAWCRLSDGRRFGALVNVGERPTFGGLGLRVEAHLLEFSEDLYGSELRLSFLRRLRGEQRFDGPEALKAQIARDAAAARTALVGA